MLALMVGVFECDDCGKIASVGMGYTVHIDGCIGCLGVDLSGLKVVLGWGEVSVWQMAGDLRCGLVIQKVN